MPFRRAPGRSPTASASGARVTAHERPWRAEPPRYVWYTLEEARELLAALEDARDSLINAGHLAAVVAIEAQVRELSRRLDFDDPWGGTDGH